jgi:hypothetical protein
MDVDERRWAADGLLLLESSGGAEVAPRIEDGPPASETGLEIPVMLLLVRLLLSGVGASEKVERALTSCNADVPADAFIPPAFEVDDMPLVSAAVLGRRAEFAVMIEPLIVLVSAAIEEAPSRPSIQPGVVR